jgi:NhaP-type Na+/H+ or K+/H+ antiporter
MKMTFDSQPDRRGVRAHMLVDVLLLLALLLCVAVFGLNVKVAAGILAMTVVITFGTYQAYRNRSRQHDNRPTA